MADEESMRTDDRNGVLILDGSSLLRSQQPPTNTKVAMAAVAAVAAVAGIIFLAWFYDSVFHAAAREQASVEEYLSREVSIDLPNVASFLGQDDATIEQALADAGYTTYVLSSSTLEEGASLNVVKLPSDVSVDDAMAMYESGVATLSASDAARLLHGSWQLDMERGSFTSARVRYADFSSASLEDAVSAAIASQGFDEASATDLSTDSSGNLFCEGTVATDSGEATWRVSAIALSSVYSIDGLPSNASYVGIRVTG